MRTPGLILALLAAGCSPAGMDLDLHADDGGDIGDDIGSVALSVTPATCTEGITASDPATGHCYMLITGGVTWEEAQQACSDLGDGAHLADITQESEHTITAALRSENNVDVVWLAGSDQASEDSWVWVSTGELITTDFWEIGEPDSRGGVDEDCLALMEPDRWHDRACTVMAGYVCERDAIPDEEPPGDGEDGDPVDPIDSDAPGSLYACSVTPPGSGSGSGPALGWLLAMLGLALATRRRRVSGRDRLMSGTVE